MKLSECCFTPSLCVCGISVSMIKVCVFLFVCQCLSQRVCVLAPLPVTLFSARGEPYACCHPLPHRITHTHNHTHTRPKAPVASLSLEPYRSSVPSLLTYTLSLTHTYTHTLPLSLSVTHIHTLSHSH